MNILYWRYELQPRAPLSAIARPGAREGALLRVGSGFADVHPWPELGDLPLDEQLARLARGETTPLTRRSLDLARLDGACREASRSLFDGVTIPESHWPGYDPPPGFSIIKVKGFDPARVPDGVRLRIDFNATLTAAKFAALELPRERVDFVEDPCPYDGPTWRELRERTGLRLALDRGEGSEGVDVLVCKPAVQRCPSTSKELVVTSYMDHPVGQLGAAYVAAQHATSVCGLLTHVLYENDPFVEQLRIDGTRLVPPPGTGIGFDDLLERLPWKRLK